MLVLDASAVIELVLGTEAGQRVAQRIRPPSESLHAPHLLAVEVAQTLRRLAAAGHLTTHAAAAALDDAAALDAHRYEHEPLLPRIWALRSTMTAYDATYVALAEVLGAPLLTLDRRLAGAPGHEAEIELVEG